MGLNILEIAVLGLDDQIIQINLAKNSVDKFIIESFDLKSLKMLLNYVSNIILLSFYQNFGWTFMP